MTMHGSHLRSAIQEQGQLSFIGIYDVFSASHHGLPDIGFITWPDIVAFTRRLRNVLPDTHIVVDMDDGYGDPEIAAQAALSLEEAGASAIIMEDQQRPRKCGHQAAA